MAAMTDPLLKALRRHRVPAWWRDAKLGIFIHWTPASVPGFAPTDVEIGDLFASSEATPLARNPYTEWYQNSLRFPGSPVATYHREQFGDRPYEAFGADFDAALGEWDPTEWARTFAAAGARYVVLVTKHHDGFCLWPSEVTNPNRAGWHTTRDVVGELGEAVRAEGLRYGLYYSGGLDWTFEPHPIGTAADVPAALPGGSYPAYAVAQVRELIRRYRPSLLWNDIGWPQRGKELWPLLAHYLHEVPDGVVNDRWFPRSPVNTALRSSAARRVADAGLRRATRNSSGIVPPRPPFFDVRTPEYTVLDDVPPWPWECVRGIDRSFGYNRESLPEHFLGHHELLDTVADIVAKGGNLLLNVGPTGEAVLPEEQRVRLRWLGEWTAVNGEGLYGTRPWVRPVASHGPLELRFTARGDDVFALVAGAPTGSLTVPGVQPGPHTAVELLTAGGPRPLPWRTGDAGIDVTFGNPPGDRPVLALRAVVAAPSGC